MTHVDGNVLSGTLSEIFEQDMTTATGECAGCGHTAEIAVALVYLSGAGTVVRCSTCGDVLFTLVEIDGHPRINLSGIALLRMP